MRVMGLDVGSKTVGVTTSDPFGWTAQGVEIIRINEAEEKFGSDQLKELAAQHEVDRFVVGLSKNINNSIGPRAEVSMSHGEEIKELLSPSVDYQDERLTTVQAERMLVEQINTLRAKRKRIIDKLATVMVLQNYLDGLGKQLF